MEFYFGPSVDLTYIQNHDFKIINVLSQISKINPQYLSYDDGYTIMETDVLQNQVIAKFKIEINNKTIPKIASLKKLLDYDRTETFKTLFNELMVENGDSNIYMTRVDGEYMRTIEKYAGYLDLEHIHDESKPRKALGGGVLFVMHSGIPKTFCNDTVCLNLGKLTGLQMTPFFFIVNILFYFESIFPVGFCRLN